MCERPVSHAASALHDPMNPRHHSTLAILILMASAVPTLADGQPTPEPEPGEPTSESEPAVASPRHTHDEHHGAHDETSGAHDHRLEIGIAPGLAYLPADSAVTAGLHLHVVAALPDSRWGLGLGLERLFDDHGHTTLSAVVQLRLIAGWSVIVAPGVTFEDGEWSSPGPSVHFETVYEFTFGAFHIGPSLEFAIDLEETHLTLGLHLGVGL